jgi:anti-anti-sigma regulatory factor
MIEVSERKIGDVTILDLSGSLVEMTDSYPFRDAVTRVLAAGAKKILLSFEQVPNVSFLGLDQVIKAFKDALRKDAKLKLLKPPWPRPREPPESSGTPGLDAYDEESRAIASFG